MPEITDPTVVAYCNEYIRPFCDRMLGLNATGDIQISKWFATIEVIIAANADTDVILDGSETGGRTPITKGDMKAVMTQALAFQAQVDGPGVLDVLTKPAVNVRF